MDSLESAHLRSGDEHAVLDAPETTTAPSGPSSSTLREVEGAPVRRSAIDTQGSPRAPHADLAEGASKRPRIDGIGIQGSWPAMRTVALLGVVESNRDEMRPGRRALSAEGRDIPPLTPQTLGHYFSKEVGHWPKDRTKLAAAMATNLKGLAETRVRSEPQIKQLRRELTLHWHCLSEKEKSDLLEFAASDTTIKNRSGKCADDANVKNWLEHTAAHMPASDVNRLLGACTDKARGTLEASFGAAGTDETKRKAVKDASADMRMTLPLDHMYDYKGFYWDNNRKVGTLPPGTPTPKVCVVGAGPAGLMAADCLNRIGVKPTVLEALDHIGGRLATHQRDLSETEGEGAKSPTTTHPGGMRFHTTPGNFYWSFAEHYELEHIDFTNPSQVGATLLLAGEVLKMEPGQEPTEPVLKKVKDDFEKAMGSLLKPIRDARDAGDTARFLELSNAAKTRFDPHTFESGVTALLKDHGIEWSKKEWDTFGAVGIGVGGYKGYYNTGFLEEMRFLVDERLENHQLLVDGADAPLKRMIEDKEGLPPGTPSLAEQGAIQLNAPVTNVEKTEAGKYKVTWSKDGVPKSEEYDEVFFAAGPQIAVKLGMSADRGAQSLVSREIAEALEKANIVGATKMTMTVPVESFHPETLPKNLQSTAEFQQLYLHPPAKEGNSAVFYLSYTLGDNAKKVEGKSKDEQIDALLNTLREAAGRQTTDPEEGQKLRNLATLIDNHRDRSHYTHWTEVETQGGAFKMDAPGDLDNTRALFAETIRSKSGLHFINEEVTAEAGFASGAFAAAVNAVQNMVKRHGGTVPRHSPIEQRIL
jgi:tryptophan 2-monooxygenase